MGLKLTDNWERAKTVYMGRQFSTNVDCNLADKTINEMGPQTIAKLVKITPISMFHDTYIVDYSY